MARRGHPSQPLTGRERRALRSLEDHPALPTLIPTLPPRTLTRLYSAVGRADAGALMAMTPPALLARALDEAVWSRTGMATRFDTDVFVDWLEVWLREGEEFTAERLLALDEDFLALCLSEVLRVEDSHVTGFTRVPEEEQEEAPLLKAEGAVLDRFLLEAVLEDEWDIVHEAVLTLWNHNPDRTLALLERLAMGGPGEGERGVLHQDVAAAREADRERAGFVPPATAKAFLAIATTHPLEELLDQSAYDLETARHMRKLRAAEVAAQTPASTGGGLDAAADVVDDGDATTAAAHPGVWHLLIAAGVLDQVTPAGLLTGPQGAPGLTLGRRLDELAVRDADRLQHTAAELAYLANVLLAGIELDGTGRRREDQARELAFATANLGIELLDAQGQPVVLGDPPGLVGAFLVAWRTLTELPGAMLHAFTDAFASSAMNRFFESRRWLHAEMLGSLQALESAIVESRLEAAREALALLSLACDTSACRAAAHLLTQPPRFPLLLDGGDKDASRWIRSVDDLERLAGVLAGLRPKR